MLATGGTIAATANADEGRANAGQSAAQSSDGANVKVNLYDYYEMSSSKYQNNNGKKNVNGATCGAFWFNGDTETMGEWNGWNREYRYSCGENYSTPMVAGENYWTTGIKPTQGLVESTLNSDGYPTLSSAITDNYHSYRGSMSNSNMKFLFGSSEYAKTYDNVSNLFTVDDSGHYVFDSQKSFAQLTGSENNWSILHKTAIKDSANKEAAKFLPFNAVDESGNLTRNGAIAPAEGTNPNLSFGMTMETKFIQPKGGQIVTGENEDGTDKKENMKFSFNGDDDVWVFIDGKLVLDIGGIHGAKEGTIDFATGEVTVEGHNPTSLSTLMNLGEGKTTLDDYSQHTLKFFYLERGGGASNCKLDFNLQTIPDGTIGVGKQITNTNTNEFSTAKFTMSVDIANEKNAGTGEYEQYETYTGKYYVCDLNTACTKPTDESKLLEVGTDGKFQIQNNQRAVLIGSESQPINVNTKYKVTEYAADGYDSTDYEFTLDGVKNDQGGDMQGTTLGQASSEVKVADHAWVTVSNKFISKDAYSFIIEKKMDGAPEDAKFTMHVTNGKNEPYTGQYYLTGADGEYAMNDPKTATSGDIELKANQSAKIISVAPGTTFHVEETGLEEGTYNTPSYADNENGDSDDQTVTVDKNMLQKTGKITVTNSLKKLDPTKSWHLDVTKMIEGKDSTTDKFTFLLKPSDDDNNVTNNLINDGKGNYGIQDETKGALLTDENGVLLRAATTGTIGSEGQTVILGPVMFAKAGTYTFDVTEEKTDDTDVNTEGTQNGDWTMDTHKATVVVEVKNKNGKLVVESVKVSENNVDSEVAKKELTFTNKYMETTPPVEPETTNTLKIEKVVKSGVWTGVPKDGYSVTVKVHNEQYADKTVEIVPADENDEQSKAEYITFDENGDATIVTTIGEANAAELKLPTGTQIVSIVEGQAQGYDFKSKITIGDKPIAECGFALDADKTVTVTNTFSGNAKLNLEGVKTVNNGTPDREGFKFALKAAKVDNAVIMPKDTTTASDKDGKFSFGTIEFTKPTEGANFYQFEVTEPKSTVPEGYTGDARVYNVNVTVGTNMKVDVTYSVLSGNTMTTVDGIEFNNTTAETPEPKPEDPKDARITVRKIVNGCNTSGSFDIVTKMANGTVDGKEMQLGRFENTQSKTYTISFNDSEESSYTVYEIETEDLAKDYTVSISNGVTTVDGATFTGTIKPGDDVTVIVTNTYTGTDCPTDKPEEGTVNLDPGAKYLTGDAALGRDDFTFDLYYGDTVDGTPDQSEYLYRVNDGNVGYFQFRNLPLTHEGANVFTIVERNDGKKGYTYDNRVYHVTINAKVKNGKLVADGNPVITVTGGEDEGSVVFRNSYEKPTEPEEPDKPTPDPGPTPDPDPDEPDQPEEPDTPDEPDTPTEPDKPDDNGSNGKDDSGTQNPGQPSLPRTGAAVTSAAGAVVLLAVAGIALTLERRRKNQR